MIYFLGALKERVIEAVGPQLPGGYWYEVANRTGSTELAQPYMVVQVDSGLHTQYTVGQLRQLDVTLNLYGSDPEACRKLMGVIVNALKSSRLQWNGGGGGSEAGMWVLSDGILQDPDREVDGSAVWRIMQTFEYQLQGVV